MIIGEEIETSVQHNILPRQEVISRLRDRSEPVLLFGESEVDAFRRLRKCELLEPEVNKVCKIETVVSKIYSMSFLFVVRVLEMIFKKLWSKLTKHI